MFISPPLLLFFIFFVIVWLTDIWSMLNFFFCYFVLSKTICHGPSVVMDILNRTKFQGALGVDHRSLKFFF